MLVHQNLQREILNRVGIGNIFLFRQVHHHKSNSSRRVSPLLSRCDITASLSGCEDLEWCGKQLFLSHTAGCSSPSFHFGQKDMRAFPSFHCSSRARLALPSGEQLDDHCCCGQDNKSTFILLFFYFLCERRIWIVSSLRPSRWWSLSFVVQPAAAAWGETLFELEGLLVCQGFSYQRKSAGTETFHLSCSDCKLLLQDTKVLWPRVDLELSLLLIITGYL